MISASFPSLLQSFLTDRLLRQRAASPHTIAGYRDCFRLLLQFAKEKLGKNAFSTQDRRSGCAFHCSISGTLGTPSQKQAVGDDIEEPHNRPPRKPITDRGSSSRQIARRCMLYTIEYFVL